MSILTKMNWKFKFPRSIGLIILDAKNTEHSAHAHFQTWLYYIILALFILVFSKLVKISK